MNERGSLQERYRLNDAINEILRNSLVDDIKIPPGTQLSEMAWQFAGDGPPVRIYDCSREQFLEIFAKLLNEIVTTQSQLQKYATAFLPDSKRFLEAVL